jgi:hypothetical protein
MAETMKDVETKYLPLYMMLKCVVFIKRKYDHIYALLIIYMHENFSWELGSELSKDK